MGVVPVSSRRMLRVFVLLACLVLLQWTLVAQTTPPAARAQATDPPNIILILTDDQRYDTLHVMPQVQGLASQGMTLRRAITTNPICCPSRATILTGRYSHTTGVYTNSLPFGGWSIFQSSESSTLATALNDAGYRTALIGKYLNAYQEAGAHVPAGWDRWFALAGPGAYYNYTVFDDQQGFVPFGSLARHYSTDVIRRKAVSFVRNAPVDEPLFLMVTPFAPHAQYIPAPRHKGRFSTARVRLGPAVNEADVSDKPAYIQEKGTVDPATLRARTRRQWESLLAVDEMVGAISAAIAETGRAENTLTIFLSDNGFMNGEHRWNFKGIPYEESIRVPFVISYPGRIPAGTVSSALVSNVDVAPTILEFAGATLPVDGVSLVPLVTDTQSAVRSEVVLEHVPDNPNRGPTYCGVRTSAFTFVRYETGEEELYDLVQDPSQLRNVASSRPQKATELRNLTMSLCQPTPPGFSW